MPKPNQKAKWRDSQKPGDFSGIRDRVNNFVDHSSDFKNRSTGIYTVGVLLGRAGIDRESVRSLDFSDYVQQVGERPDQKMIVTRYKARNRQYANIPYNRIIVMRSRPRIDYNVQGKLAQPLSSKTMQTMIGEFVSGLKQLKQQRTITVKNIADLVARSTYSPTGNTLKKLSSAELKHREDAKLKQTPLLSAILSTYISKPDSGANFYPLQVVPSLDALKQYGTAVQNSVAIDFGEVIAPIAVLTGNATGNAMRLSREMLGVTTRKLMQGATIHFNAGAGDQLYDSFIEYNGKVIGLSSKGHVAGAAAGAGTSISSLGHAVNEIKANPVALKRLQPLLAVRDNRNMFDIVSILADEAGHGLKWDKTLRILQRMDKEYNQSDLYKDMKYIRSLGNEKDNASAVAFGRNMSQYIRARMSAAKPRARRGSDEGKKPESAFSKMLRAANTEIAQRLNSNPKFSEVCTWILNHSNTVQIDLYTNKAVLEEAKKKSGPEYGGAMVVTNIVATWPSTRVDTVQLLENVGDMKFMLGVNGYASQFPDRTQMPWVDTDFRDQIKSQSTDRDGSDLKSASDWATNGVLQPRTSVELPGVDNTPHDVIPAPQQVTQPRQARQSRQQRAQIDILNTTWGKFSQFLKTSGRIARSVNGIVGACIDLLKQDDAWFKRNIDEAQFVKNFVQWLNTNPDVLAVLQRDGTNSVDIGALNEVAQIQISEENQIHLLSTLYWTLVARKHYLSNNVEQFRIAMDHVITVVQKMTDDGSYGASMSLYLARFRTIQRQAVNTLTSESRSAILRGLLG